MTENLKKFAAATNNELFDAEYEGGEWMCEHVETQETLEQWEESSKGWNERTAMKTGEIGGFPFRAWKNVQAVKLGRHGGIEAPVRANSRQGIVLGQDAVAKSDAAEAIAAPATDRKARRRWSRLFRR